MPTKQKQDSGAMRPLVRAYGIVTCKPVDDILKMERRTKAKNVVWIGMDEKGLTGDSKVIHRIGEVRKETPAFADALEAFAKTNIVADLGWEVTDNG